MTTARQQRKYRAFGHLLGLLLGLALCGGILRPLALGAAPEDRTVVNAQTGLAISGLDPVAYFTDSKPKFGRPDLELSLDGVVWRFSNEGNRAAFAERPDVYRPQFGGYDPVAVARGASVPGHPMLWAVIAGRLYLFYDDAARAAFIADPGRIIETAERRWPAVVRTTGH